jgi:hypothetical protein
LIPLKERAHKKVLKMDTIHFSKSDFP